MVTVSTKIVPPSFPFFVMQHGEMLGLRWKSKVNEYMLYANEQTGLQFGIYSENQITKIILYVDSPPSEIPDRFQRIIQAYEEVLGSWTDNTEGYSIHIDYQLKAIKVPESNSRLL